ncbi:hypothetical protein HQ41_08880 [Porphyromonas sp. COT-290 OH860]|nr:hypothetical protein HQ41_08880 [Porphyromonas sp. COT-290 OH860]
MLIPASTIRLVSVDVIFFIEVKEIMMYLTLVTPSIEPTAHRTSPIKSRAKVAIYPKETNMGL